MRRVSLLLAGALLVAGCGGGDGESEPAADEGQETTSETTEETTDGETESSEDGVTPPGTDLEVGEAATFAWQPKRDLDATLEVRVDEIEQTTMDSFSAFRLDRSTRRSTPYYVRVSVENVGKGNVGGTDLPLFLDNGSDVLFPSALIKSSFKPCPSRPLPEKFTPGKRTKLCMVFLAPDRTELSAVALRPTEEVLPITWSGEVTKADEPKKKKSKKKDAKNQQ